MIVQYIIIVGIILLISWGVRYLSYRMVQRDSEKRSNNH